MTIRRVLLAATAVLALYAAPALAVQCGDTIGPGQVVVLDADLTCAPAVGAAGRTLAGGTLDLNGHTLTCDCGALLCSGDGVLVNGDRSVLRDRGKTPGLITGCTNAVTIQASRTTVKNVHAADVRRGFVVAAGAEKTTLLDNSAIRAETSGFERFGDRVLALRNEVRRAEFGFFTISDKNILRANLVEDIFSVGFWLLDNSHNQIQNNISRRSLSVGFIINGASHMVSRNTATGSSSGIALRDGATRVKVTGNTVTGNHIGINVAGFATANLIQRNIATGNTEVDLLDQSFGCLNNTWRKNTHDTESVDCIE